MLVMGYDEMNLLLLLAATEFELLTTRLNN